MTPDRRQRKALLDVAGCVVIEAALADQGLVHVVFPLGRERRARPQIDSPCKASVGRVGRDRQPLQVEHAEVEDPPPLIAHPHQVELHHVAHDPWRHRHEHRQGDDCRARERPASAASGEEQRRRRSEQQELPSRLDPGCGAEEEPGEDEQPWTAKLDTGRLDERDRAGEHEDSEEEVGPERVLVHDQDRGQGREHARRQGGGPPEVAPPDPDDRDHHPNTHQMLGDRYGVLGATRQDLEQGLERRVPRRPEVLAAEAVPVDKPVSEGKEERVVAVGRRLVSAEEEREPDEKSQATEVERPPRSASRCDRTPDSRRGFGARIPPAQRARRRCAHHREPNRIEPPTPPRIFPSRKTTSHHG